MMKIKRDFILLLFVLFVLFISWDRLFAQGRFVGDTWLSDSSLVVGDFPFSGNVGINTTRMTAPLVVQGKGQATYTTLEARKPNGQTSFIIKDDGNVGIGSSLPSAKLDISGTVAATNLISNVYTPTLTGVMNVDTSTVYEAQYLKLGSVVVVSGKIDVTALGAGDTELGVSLPIASNLGAEEDLAGTGASSVSGTAAISIRADASNNRASFQFSSGDTSNNSYFFVFSYQII